LNSRRPTGDRGSRNNAGTGSQSKRSYAGGRKADIMLATGSQSGRSCRFCRNRGGLDLAILGLKLEGAMEREMHVS